MVLFFVHGNQMSSTRQIQHLFENKTLEEIERVPLKWLFIGVGWSESCPFWAINYLLFIVSLFEYVRFFGFINCAAVLPKKIPNKNNNNQFSKRTKPID